MKQVFSLVKSRIFYYNYSKTRGGEMNEVANIPVCKCTQCLLTQICLIGNSVVHLLQCVSDQLFTKQFM